MTKDEIIKVLADYLDYCWECGAWTSFDYHGPSASYRCQACGHYIDYRPDQGTLDRLRDVADNIMRDEES